MIYFYTDTSVKDVKKEALYKNILKRVIIEDINKENASYFVINDLTRVAKSCK